MFIIWSGWGIVAPFIIMIPVGIISMVADTITHKIDYCNSHTWLYMIGGLIGSLLCWYIGKFINKDAIIVLQDAETGKKFKIDRTHSFFFIPIEYWAFIGAIGSVYALFG